MTQDDMNNPQELSRAMFELRRTHGNALSRLDRFVREHPYMIAPNVIELLKYNLQENMEIIDKAGQEGGPS